MPSASRNALISQVLHHQLLRFPDLRQEMRAQKQAQSTDCVDNFKAIIFLTLPPFTSK